MSTHRVPADELEVTLVQLVRSGEHIDAYYKDDDGHFVIVTEDHIETRGGAA